MNKTYEMTDVTLSTEKVIDSLMEIIEVHKRTIERQSARIKQQKILNTIIIVIAVVLIVATAIVLYNRIKPLRESKEIEE